jgi:hypothetical protein
VMLKVQIPVTSARTLLSTSKVTSLVALLKTGSVGSKRRGMVRSNLCDVGEGHAVFEYTLWNRRVEIYDRLRVSGMAVVKNALACCSDVDGFFVKSSSC